MAILDIFKRAYNLNKVEKRGSLNPAGLFSAAWDILSNSRGTSAGQEVNETIALQHVSVYACVRVIAESVGSLTPRLYRRVARGREEAIDNPLHYVFSIAPNSDMSAPTFWESMAGGLALTGNCYAQILRNAMGQPVVLYPLDPRQTKPVRMPDKSIAYKTTVDSDGLGRIVASADMLHVSLFSFDGLVGLSPIMHARETIGLAIATEKFGSRFFGNGSMPSAILTPIGDISAEDLQNMRDGWEKMNSAESQGRVGVLPSDWKYQALSLSPEQSQFLKTKQMSRTDIAALFRVPANMIGDTTRLSNSNHEQMSLQFVTDTLRPYLVHFEREIARKMLPRDQSLFLEFDVSDRLRGDFASTMQGFAIGKQWGVYSTNDVRLALGENPIGAEGDIYWAPVNYTNAESLITPATDPQPLPLLDPPKGNNAQEN